MQSSDFFFAHDCYRFLKVSHTLTMSNVVPAGYKFGTTYVGGKLLSQSEGFPLLMADLDPSGNLNANVIHAPTTHTRSGHFNFFLLTFFR